MAYLRCLELSSPHQMKHHCHRHCYASLQVQALGNVPCRAAIMRKPAPRPPGQVTALLHPGVSDALRTAALLGAWVSDGVRWTVGAVDRQNATGTQDDLKVHLISGVIAWFGDCLSAVS